MIENPYRPWGVVTYNLTTKHVVDLAFFETHPLAQKWIDFLTLNAIGVYSLNNRVYEYEKDGEKFTMEIKHK